MTIEDAEVVFGKRWNAWTPAEVREFVATLTAEDCRTPLALRLALEHPDVMPLDVKNFLTFLRQRGTEIPRRSAEVGGSPA